jgi:hypothetical protein
MDIAIDLGKRRSYVVMEDNGKMVKEGYVETTKDGFFTFVTKSMSVFISLFGVLLFA